MDGKSKLAIVTNVALALIILTVGAVCFIPLGISTAGGKSDGVYYNGNTDSDMISLMFNVYQGSEYVLDIMDSLDEYGVKATFFVGGSWADDNTEVLREIASRGHELGNHGYFHKDHDKLNAAGKPSGNISLRRTGAGFDRRADQTVRAALGCLLADYGRSRKGIGI